LALTPAPDAEPVDRVAADPPDRWAVLVGAEGPGLTAGALAGADRRVRIPLAPGVDSLNVATAAAVVLHRLDRPAPGSGEAAPA
ncbi:MAG: TrmH family RNA methyltransferase, partial [Acidimicrobiia bacterium]